MPASVRLCFFASAVTVLGAVACFVIGSGESEPMFGLIVIMAGVIISFHALGLGVLAIMLWDWSTGLPFMKYDAAEGYDSVDSPGTLR